MTLCAGIIGTGEYVPETVRNNAWWPSSYVEEFNVTRKGDVTSPSVFLSRAKTDAQRIQFEHMLKTYDDPFRGTVERRVLEPEHAPSFMEIKAGRKAIANAGLQPEDIDFILVNSLPSDKASPCNAGLVAGGVGAVNATSIGIDFACTSFLAGLTLADSMVRSGTAKNVLVVCSAAHTRLAAPNDHGAVNFGDGAGAAVVGVVEAGLGIRGHASKTMAKYHDAIWLAADEPGDWFAAGGALYARAGNLQVGREVIMQSADFAVESTRAALRAADMSASDITHWYSHQPMLWFNEACRTAAGFATAKTMETFTEVAGLGPANIPFNLARAVQAGQLRKGDNVMLFACGAGYHWAAAVLTWAT